MRTIENWAAAGNIQQNEKGKYGLISAFRFQLGRLEEDLAKLSDEKAELIRRLNENYAEARERKAIAEADKEVAYPLNKSWKQKK